MFNMKGFGVKLCNFTYNFYASYIFQNIALHNRIGEYSELYKKLSCAIRLKKITAYLYFF